MKNLIIDLVKENIQSSFRGAGFGNIVYIIGFCLSNLKNNRIPIFVNIGKNYFEKITRDSNIVLENLKFENFNIQIINDLKDGIIINDCSILNDASNNSYIINNTHVKGLNGLFSLNNSYKIYGLNLSFKDEQKFDNYFSTKFNDIENSIIINVRRGEKLLEKWNRYLIVHQNTYHEIIKENQNEQIIFISDDIQWCKDNFKTYSNVKFYEDNSLKDKMIYDQYLMSECKHLVFNLDCTFSHIPFLIKNNKIQKATIIINENEFEKEISLENSSYNVLKNSFKKETNLIIGKSGRN